MNVHSKIQTRGNTFVTISDYEKLYSILNKRMDSFFFESDISSGHHSGPEVNEYDDDFDNSSFHTSSDSSNYQFFDEDYDSDEYTEEHGFKQFVNRSYDSLKKYLVDAGYCTSQLFDKLISKLKKCYFSLRALLWKCISLDNLGRKSKVYLVKIFSLIGDILFFLICFRMVKDKKIVMMLCASFVSKCLMAVLLDNLSNGAWTFGGVPSSGAYGFESFVNDTKIPSNLNTLIDSSIANLLYDVFVDAISLNLLPREWSNRIKHLFVGYRSNYSKPVSMMTFVMDMFQFVDVFIDKSRKYIEGNISLLEFFDSDFSQYQRNVELLKRQETFIKYSTCDTSSGRQHITEYSRRIDAAITEGNKFFPICKKEKIPVLKNILLDLKTIRMNIRVQLRSSLRRSPIGIVVEGNPGVGKSTVLKAIHKIWCSHSKIDYEDSLVFTRNVDSKHWTNYDPLSNPIIHYSELGSQNQYIVKNKGDPVLSEILRVIDVAPMTAEMADVESKGKIHIIPDLVTADTNTANLNAKYTNAAPSAVLRRFIFVHVDVKPEYRSADGSSLDPIKARNSSDCLNVWNFEVYLQRPRDNFESEKDVLFTANNMADFRDKMKDIFAEREISQESHRNALDRDPSMYTTESFHRDALLWCTGTFELAIVYRVLRYMFFEDSTKNGKFVLLGNIISYVWYYFYCLVMFGLPILWLEYNPARYVYRRIYPDAKFSGNPKLFDYLNVLGFLSSVFGCLYASYSLAVYVQKYSTESDVHEVERDIGAGFPNPRKKKTSDDTYDDVVEFEPRIGGNAQQHNKTSHVVSTIERNKRFVKIIYTDKRTESTVLTGLIGNLAIINTHAIASGAIHSIQISSHREFAQSIVKCTYDQFAIFSMDNDLSFVLVPRTKFKDITKYLMPTRSFLKFGECSNSSFLKCMGNVASFCDKPDRITNRQTGISTVIVEKIRTSNHLKTGDCGSPYIVTAGRVNVLAAIHAAGNSFNMKIGSIFSLEDVNLAISHFQENGLSYISSVPNVDVKLAKKLHRKNPINYEQVTGLKVLGEITSLPRPTSKSSLKPFPFTDKVAKILNVRVSDSDGNPLFGVPVMRSFTRDGVFYNPYNIWLRKIKNSEINYISPDVMRNVAEGYSRYLIKNIDVNIQPLSLEVAINGFAEDFYTRPLNKSTGAGVLFPGKKKNYLIQDKSGRYHPTKQLYNAVSNTYTCLQEGQSVNAILGATLKDEVLPIDKVTNAKTRIFFTAPIDLVIVQRMMLMPIYSFMIERRDLFKCKIGINMDSPEADKMFKLLTSNGDRIFEGDYSGYDTTMPFILTEAAYDVVYNIAKSLGYNDEALRILKNLLDDSKIPLVNFNGTLVEIAGLQPSGKYGTAEDNSLKGVLLLAYFFAILYTPHGKDNKFNVSTSYTLSDFWKLAVWVYGDDVIGNVPEEFEEFNALNYSNFCKEIYNMKFTSASKGDIESKFVTIENMSFLKRRFRYHTILGRHVAALDKSSIAKMITFFSPSKFISELSLAVETLDAALRASFMWCDTSDRFDSMRKQLIHTLTLSYDISYEILDSHLPTVQTFLDAEKKFEDHTDPGFYTESSIDQKIETKDESKKSSVATVSTPSGDQKMQHGMETHNTLSTMEERKHEPPPVDYNVSSLLSNYFYIGSFKNKVFSFFPFYELFAKPAVYDRLMRHVSFSAGITIRIEWSASIEDFGMGYMAFYPNFRHNSTVMSMLQYDHRVYGRLMYLSNNPTKTRIWIENGSSATLSIPFYSVKEYASFSGLSSTQWFERLKNLGLVHFAVETSTAQLEFRIYIKFDDLKLGPQIPFFFESKVDSESNMKIEDSNDPIDLTHAVDFKKILSIPTFIGKYTLRIYGDVIIIPVNPFAEYGLLYWGAIEHFYNVPNNHKIASNMHYFSKAFTYWRGSITFNFNIVTPKLARGFVKFEYIPGIFFNNNILTHDSMGSVQSYNVDLSIQRSLTVTVPMTHLVPHFFTDRNKPLSENTNGLWKVTFQGITNTEYQPHVGGLWVESYSTDMQFLSPRNLHQADILKFRPLLTEESYFTESLVVAAEAASGIVETALEIATAVKGLSEVYDYFMSDTNTLNESLVTNETVATVQKKNVILCLPRFPFISSSYKKLDQSNPMWYEGNVTNVVTQFSDTLESECKYTFFEHCRNTFAFMGGTTRWTIVSSGFNGHCQFSYTHFETKPNKYVLDSYPTRLLGSSAGNMIFNTTDDKIVITMSHDSNVPREYAMYDPHMGREYMENIRCAVGRINLIDVESPEIEISFSVGKDFRFECFCGAPIYVESYREGMDPLLDTNFPKLRKSSLKDRTFPERNLEQLIRRFITQSEASSLTALRASNNLDDQNFSDPVTITPKQRKKNIIPVFGNNIFGAFKTKKNIVKEKDEELPPNPVDNKTDHIKGNNRKTVMFDMDDYEYKGPTGTKEVVPALPVSEDNLVYKTVIPVNLKMFTFEDAVEIAAGNFMDNERKNALNWIKGTKSARIFKGEIKRIIRDNNLTNWKSTDIYQLLLVSISKCTRKDGIIFHSIDKIRDTIIKMRKDLSIQNPKTAMKMSRFPFIICHIINESSVFQVVNTWTTKPISTYNKMLTLYPTVMSDTKHRNPEVLSYMDGVSIDERSRARYVSAFMKYFMLMRVPIRQIERVFNIVVSKATPDLIRLHDDWYSRFYKYRIEQMSYTEDHTTAAAYLIILPGEKIQSVLNVWKEIFHDKENLSVLYRTVAFRSLSLPLHQKGERAGVGMKVKNLILSKEKIPFEHEPILGLALPKELPVPYDIERIQKNIVYPDI